MGKRHDQLAKLEEELKDLENLRDSGFADKKAIEEKIDDLYRRIDDFNDDYEEALDEELAEERAAAEAAKPMDIDSVKNFETFPPLPDEQPAPPEDVEEPEPAARADGGDVQRPDSVLPDLGWKPPKGPLSDEAEARIDGAEERLPSLVGDSIPPMGGPVLEELLHPDQLRGKFDIDSVKNFETFPPLPDAEPATPAEEDGEIAGRGGMPGMFVGVSIAVVVLILALIAFMRMSAPQVATSATGSAPAAAGTSVPTAATQPSGPPAQAAAVLGYQCVGNQKALFDNSNGNLVANGATGGPKVSTSGKTYCLVSMRTYHWNDGKGAAPGRIGLLGGAGDVGPFPAQGTSGQGGAQNVNWIYVPDPPAKQLLNGDYTCYDSDRTTWSQNDASGRLGFCVVFVQDAVKQ